MEILLLIGIIIFAIIWFILSRGGQDDQMKNARMVKWPDGTNLWYLHNKLHRADGPAIAYSDGVKLWYLHGERHRVGGPAVEWSNGKKEWWLHGKELNHPKEFETMEEFLQELNDNEAYSLQWISDINGMIEIIKEPSGKQTRLHAMRWKI